MKNLNGVVVGVVKDLDDPLGQSRIRLQFPWLSSTELSGWAPIARIMSGKGRGQFFMPELEDEALVCFEHGDFDHPFVVGFLHNGIDLQPDQNGGGKHVRRIQTVSGHILDFDDTQGQEQIRLTSKGGNKLKFDDTGGQEVITLESNGGNSLVINDPAGTVDLSFGTLGGSVSLSSSTAVITLGAASISVAAAGVTIIAPAVTVTAATADFSGTITAVAIAAGAITGAPTGSGMSVPSITCSGNISCADLTCTSFNGGPPP